MVPTSQVRSPDTVDRRLLVALRAEGRATYAELGRRVGLSAPSVHERVRRLEEAGLIRGYHAAVPPAVLGLPVSALVSIYQTDSADQDDVAAGLARLAEVEDCWSVAGDEAFVVRVRVPNVDALEASLGRLRRLPGVARTRTTVVLSTRFEGRVDRLAELVEAAGARPADDAGPGAAEPGGPTGDGAG